MQGEGLGLGLGLPNQGRGRVGGYLARGVGAQHEHLRLSKVLGQ